MTTPTITKEDVAKIADLARLQLTDEELSAATADLKNILAHFAAIQAIDTTGVPTADDASGRSNVTRSDKAAPEELATHKELLEAAPQVKDNHVQVKAVF